MDTGTIKQLIVTQNSKDPRLAEALEQIVKMLEEHEKRIKKLE
jgi:hypothetical protein